MDINPNVLEKQFSFSDEMLKKFEESPMTEIVEFGDNQNYNVTRAKMKTTSKDSTRYGMENISLTNIVSNIS